MNLRGVQLTDATAKVPRELPVGVVGSLVQ